MYSEYGLESGRQRCLAKSSAVLFIILSCALKKNAYPCMLRADGSRKILPEVELGWMVPRAVKSITAANIRNMSTR